MDEWAQERPRPLPDGADRAAFAFPAFDPTCPIVLDDRPRALSLVAAQPATLGFDLAEFLTGDEALKALVEDGFSEDDYANDYYVRNRSPRLRTLPVADDVAVEEVDWPDGTSPRPSDLPTLAARINARGDEQPSFWLEVRDGRVVAIEEQYLA